MSSDAGRQHPAIAILGILLACASTLIAAMPLIVIIMVLMVFGDAPPAPFFATGIPLIAMIVSIVFLCRGRVQARWIFAAATALMILAIATTIHVFPPILYSIGISAAAAVITLATPPATRWLHQRAAGHPRR